MLDVTPHIYQTALLDELRREVNAIVTSTVGKSGYIRKLDITGLGTNCPLCTSTSQEVLRHRYIASSVRQVIRDTVLDRRRLLRKDCMIQMPSAVIHKDILNWGADVDQTKGLRKGLRLERGS